MQAWEIHPVRKNTGANEIRVTVAFCAFDLKRERSSESRSLAHIVLQRKLLLVEGQDAARSRAVLHTHIFRTGNFQMMVLPLIAHEPRIVPVTPWESVSLMNPWGRNSAMKLPSALKVIDSFMSPTVPSQLPTIFAA